MEVENQGVTFKSVFDEHTQSIGSICIDQQHPDTVWVGTGEPWTRNSTSVGTGIYRTVNGGEKWELMGLEKSERIAKVILHPASSNTIYVAVLGALWSDSEERGFYKSTDGGKTWSKTLYVNPSTGCASLAVDPNNPEIVYAAMWDFRRQAHTFRSGGPGSGIYKSSDGGNTWKQIQNGLPNETLGRIALTVSSVNPYYLYALVESDKSALYRSTDKGESWGKMSEQTAMGERPFYFSNIVADPVDSARIYKPGFILLVSNNGGKIFQGAAVEGGAYHVDIHALWISPKDNGILYMGTDGGIYLSVDKGNTWRQIKNLPVSQFYHVSLDMAKPYNVYGGLQDNGSWKAPSQKPGGIQSSDWQTIGYGDGFNAYADRTDENIVYWQYQGGRIYRSNLQNGETKYIKPFPDAATEDLRYNWNTPVIFSKTTSTLYVGSQYLFRSNNRGDTWERISPDLTTDDPNRQLQEQSGGITPDNTTAENNCTIFTIAESPKDENVVWAGTDDGNVQLTTDGGKTWNKQNINITGLPPFAYISYIDADNFDRNAAYVTVDAHRNGYLKPYVFYTSDLGRTWKPLATDSIKSYCHVIKQDVINPDLLFVGTEAGLYVSIDKGANWVRMKSKIPQVGIYDMAIHPREHDLVLATHGRGIIIIDDITPLRNFKPEMQDTDVVFLPTKPYHFPTGGIVQDFPGDEEFVGRNPTGAATVVYYMQKRHVFGDMYLEVYDTEGKLLKKQPAGNRKGFNKVQVNTMMEPPKVPSSPNPLFEAAFGPELEPGTYSIKLVKGDKNYSSTLTLNDNPDITHSDEDKKLRHETMLRAYDMLEELAYVDRQILEIRDQTKLIADSVRSKGLRAQSFELSRMMEGMHEQISATQPGEGGIPGQIRLREKIAEIYGAVGGYGGKPTNVQLQVLDLYETQVKNMQAKVDVLVKGDLAAYNKGIEKQGLQPTKITTREEFFKE
jgi:photosystem II stability/assembly factor-like uncharacterized protein